MRLIAGGKTDRGLKRSHNEDSLSVCPELGVCIVADGMGGHNAGEVASRSAILSIVDFLRHCETDRESTWPFGIDHARSENENKLLTAIRLANRDVCSLSLEKREYAGMGTTIVAILFNMMLGEAALAHVGDSRGYLIRDGQIVQLTQDHSWVSEQVQKKILTAEEARNHRWKNVITRALGNKMDVEIDIQTVPVKPGDLFLLCSDGLSSLVEDQTILDVAKISADLDECCDRLVQAANDRGGHDNISVVLVSVQSDAGAGEKEGEGMVFSHFGIAAPAPPLTPPAPHHQEITPSYGATAEAPETAPAGDSPEPLSCDSPPSDSPRETSPGG